MLAKVQNYPPHHAGFFFTAHPITPMPHRLYSMHASTPSMAAHRAHLTWVGVIASCALLMTPRLPAQAATATQAPAPRPTFSRPTPPATPPAGKNARVLAEVKLPATATEGALIIRRIAPPAMPEPEALRPATQPTPPHHPPQRAPYHPPFLPYHHHLPQRYPANRKARQRPRWPQRPHRTPLDQNQPPQL